jgi:hypothetical protein
MRNEINSLEKLILNARKLLSDSGRYTRRGIMAACLSIAGYAGCSGTDSGTNNLPPGYDGTVVKSKEYKHSVGFWIDGQSAESTIADEIESNIIDMGIDKLLEFTLGNSNPYGVLVQTVMEISNVGGGPVDGFEYFHYNEAYLLTDLSAKKFAKLIDEGKMVVEFRMHLKPSGAARNHGTGFRLNEKHMVDLYEEKEIIM